MVTGPIVPVLFAAFLVWAGSVIEDGYRRKKASKRNGLAALERTCERARRGA